MKRAVKRAGRQIPALALLALLALPAPLPVPLPVLLPVLLPVQAAETPLPAAAAAPAPAADATPDPPTPDPGNPDPGNTAAEADLFAMPRLTAAARAALDMAEGGNVGGAEALLAPSLAEHPGVAMLQATGAALAMLAGDAAAARAGLARAGGAGFPELAAWLADPLFAPLAADPELAALAAAPPAPPPAPPPAAAADGMALVSGANTAWDPGAERLEARFTLPEKASDKAGGTPVLPPLPKAAAWDILREHARRGRAAGNLGDLYDNRDRGHSRLDPKAHPQVTALRYSEAARAADVDYGLNDSLLFGRPTFGNSSTAITGTPLWRSLPRYAMTSPDGTGPLRLWQNASQNQLYIYPAHKDYGADAKDEGTKAGDAKDADAKAGDAKAPDAAAQDGEAPAGEAPAGEAPAAALGDLFPANTPYVIVTHGSSGSDQPFLDAVAMILAAFRPDTKARLTTGNLIVPTVQMVFRRSQQNVLSRDDYMSAAGNPAAFERFNLNIARMVSLAQSIKPDAIPPQVLIRMVAEDEGKEGVDWFGEGLSEQLFDTPAAIARVWRSKAFTRHMTVSADATRDPNGRPLTFAWRLMQGDPAHVRITPAADGRSAEIEVDWHEPFAISKDNPLRSARVDIGVFANNGVHDSAPAILSIDFPTHEARTYAPGPDGRLRIAAIDRADPARAGLYADPMLVARADWQDRYDYGPDGALLGWTRTRDSGPAEDFAADGRRILGRGPDGAPLALLPVAYPLRRDADGRLRVEEAPAPDTP